MLPIPSKYKIAESHTFCKWLTFCKYTKFMQHIRTNTGSLQNTHIISEKLSVTFIMLWYTKLREFCIFAES